MKQILLDKLINAGQRAASADNIQPWCFHFRKNEVSVEYDAARLGLTTFGSNEPATLIAMGSVLENILQASDFLGLKAERQQGVNPDAYFTLSFNELNIDKAKNALLTDHPLFKRHTNRFSYKSTPIQPEVALEVGGFRERNSHLKFLDGSREIKAIALAARQASEVRFQTREVHEWLARSLRFTKEEASRGDGLDLATIPLPPGGSLFMRFIMDWKWMSNLNRLGAYKLMAALDVKLLEQAPAIIALVGGSARDEVIEAGRLMTRVWIELNSRGIAVQPYYVVSDQLQRLLEGKVPVHLQSQVNTIADQTANLLDISEHQRLHMLLRIGYPTRDPVRSKRLPLDVVCHEESVH